ncbi:MAG: cupin domain-containing protein [Thermodesulfobacteriota bacterium]
MTKNTVVIKINSMEWQPSPSTSVWRKRLEHIGEVESGIVTSIVRYDPDSKFKEHNHPDGEEIFVLDGTFSDEHGDWPEGTYLLNPEGHAHSPRSQKGCTLFVKLRQYPGKSRKQITINTNEISWKKNDNNKKIKTLYKEDGYPEEMRLEKWDAGTEVEKSLYPKGAEILVLKGTLQDENGFYSKLNWLKFPPNSTHKPFSENGCEFYIKTGSNF